MAMQACAWHLLFPDLSLRQCAALQEGRWDRQRGEQVVAMDEAAPCGTNSKQKVECGGSEVAAAEPGADEQHGNHVTAAASADDPFGLEDMLKQEKSEKNPKSVPFLRSSHHVPALQQLFCHNPARLSSRGTFRPQEPVHFRCSLQPEREKTASTPGKDNQLKTLKHP